MPTISTEMANSLVTNLGAVTTSLFDSLIALSPFLLTLAGLYFLWRFIKVAILMNNITSFEEKIELRKDFNYRMKEYEEYEKRRISAIKDHGYFDPAGLIDDRDII